MLYWVRKFLHCLLLLILVIQLCGCKNRETVVQTAPTAAVTETTVPEMTEAPETTEETIPETTIPEEMPDETAAAEAAEETAAETEVPAEEIEDVPPKVGELVNLNYMDFVDVTLYIPDVYVELRYAQENNFTGERIYNFRDAYVRYGTVQKLQNVCRELAQQGLYLKIWDAFRPTSAQFKLWSIYPDPNYVADPNRGFSAHSRGNTVDVTLVDASGNELEMPTEFDDFTEAANRDYSKCSEEARKNAELLESVMEKHGFQGYWGEWWHFTDTMQYDVEKVFDPNDISVWYPDCNEYITLRDRPSGYADAVDTIAKGWPFRVLGYTGQFAMAEFLGQRGYVLTRYIKETP